MVINNVLIFFSMFLIGILVFCLKCKHLLLMLLSLEFIMLSLFFGLQVSLTYYYYETNFSMVFLTMSVCEGSLGLSILVLMVRSYGNDYFQSFNILW
uniref:NADH-ubiquinone oxidoreductase chain 4L n=1 Tax=Emeia pseudosauteri TaxID=2592744 RepID=A0A5C0PYU0_9COLE|nr:NADH dehydrogenase subunit 4L [Emeia pseudosauteri]QEJ81587.1 NADH dehydrogenase subunit 4L [Emeia pseudosauteri]